MDGEDDEYVPEEGEETFEEGEPCDEEYPEEEALEDDAGMEDEPVEGEEALDEQVDEEAEELDPEEQPEVEAETGADEDGEDQDAAADEDWEEQLGDAVECLHGSNKFCVRMRQKLGTPRLAEQFIVALREHIELRKSEGKVPVIYEDFDISQNMIPTEQLSDLFAALADTDVQVERLRAFGVPTLDDEAASALAGWLSGVTTETAPFEMHLSDCAITEGGFEQIVQAVEENETFPAPDPKNKHRGKLPLYVRIEHNYIDVNLIEQKISDGVCMAMRKADRIPYGDTIKLRIMVNEGRNFQQHQGPPPAPEDAPPPKRVKDEKGKGKGKGKDDDRKGKGKGKKGKGDRDYGYGYDDDRKGKKGKGKGKDDDRKGKGKGKKAKGDRDYGDRDYGAARPLRFDRDREAPRRSEEEGARRPRLPRSREGKGKSRAEPPWESRRSEPRDDRRPPIRREALSRRQASPARHAYPRSSQYREERRPAERAPLRGSVSRMAPERDEPYNAFAPRGAKGGDRPATARYPAKRASADMNREEPVKRARTTEQTGAPPGNWDPGPTRKVDREKDAGRPEGGKRPSARGGDKLPPNWEKHYSDEHGINYWWNAKSGDSSWEEPK